MKKAFINKLWALWNTTGVFDDVEEYAVMIEALMSDKGIRFESDEIREWFYETINTDKKFTDFLGTCVTALDFSHCIHNVELGR